MTIANYLMNNYGARRTTLVKGEGAYLWDSDGKRYLDALSGIAVCGLGHCHPAVTEAVCKQASTLVHCSNLFNIEAQQELGTKLAGIAGMDKVFFANSGAEANEAAIKIARKYGQEKGIARPEVITATNSFHGRTMATISATGNMKVKTGFTPLLDGFAHVDYNNVAALEAAATASTVAIMLEPIQGEGGIVVPDHAYLSAVRRLCDKHGWLLILDEIQTGNGRTGSYFAFEQHAVVPDILTTAKGLGNGFPIGACLAKGPAADVLQPGNHGSTFGGNPIACQAGLAVVNTLLQGDIMALAARRGNTMLAQFRQRLDGHSRIADIRGRGMMLGIELREDCGHLVEEAKAKNLIINVTAGKTIRLLPPLIIDDVQAQTIVDTVCELVEDTV